MDQPQLNLLEWIYSEGFENLIQIRQFENYIRYQSGEFYSLILCDPATLLTKFSVNDRESMAVTFVTATVR